LQIAAKQLQLATWLLLTAYRNLPTPYPTVPSPTVYDVPFRQYKTLQTDRRQTDRTSYHKRDRTTQYGRLKNRKQSWVVSWTIAGTLTAGILQQFSGVCDDLKYVKHSCRQDQEFQTEGIETSDRQQYHVADHTGNMSNAEKYGWQSINVIHSNCLLLTDPV